ncbi:hypothetical protein CVCC1112_1421 [Paenarthrobacter nicotinovorans]|nr:hypothetical protein CVCC1112_1421 [Paenarthrobacter nicotinovorans]
MPVTRGLLQAADKIETGKSLFTRHSMTAEPGAKACLKQYPPVAAS